MGGVNFLLQNRRADENCYRRTLSICLKLRISIANMQAISKSNTIDKTASIFIIIIDDFHSSIWNVFAIF